MRVQIRARSPSSVKLRFVPGIPGLPNVLAIGTVTTGSPGSSAAASITGTSPAQTLNLTLPRGEAGAPNSLSIGSVTTGSPGSSAAASIAGAAPSQTLSLTIPRGDVGAPNSLSIGAVTTGAAGSSASATITGTAPSQTLSLTIPKGDTGDITAGAAAALADAQAAAGGVQQLVQQAAGELQAKVDEASDVAANVRALAEGTFSAAQEVGQARVEALAAASAAATSAALITIPAYNRIVNGGFTVNQRVYASGAALAAGAFGHDRWKAGSGGCTYTFTQSATDTNITITAGTLVHTYHADSVEGGAYTLSWTGTAQARVAVNGGSPSGSYAASPITLPTATAGQNIALEFGTGTLRRVTLTPGATASAFIPRFLAHEIALCMRDYQKTFPPSVAPADGTNNYTGALPSHAIIANAIPILRWQFAVPMRIAPTLAFFNPASGGTAGHWSAGGRAAAATANPGTSEDSAHISTTGGAPTIAAGAYAAIHATASTGF